MTQDATIDEYSPNIRISRVQAAAMIGVSRQTLANWSERGKGPPYIQAEKGAGCFYEPEQVKKWIEEATTTPEKKRAESD